MSDLFVRFDAPFTERQVVKLRADLLVWMESLEAPGEAGYRLMAVVDELFCNLMEHSGASWAQVKGRAAEGAAFLEMQDDGAAFDSFEASKKDYSLYLQEDTDRRLGLYLIGRVARRSEYQRIDGKVNKMTFEVPFDPPLPSGAEKFLKPK